jgi:hypothetical protein
VETGNVPRYRSLVDTRATLTAAQGLGSRFHQVLSPRAGAQSTGWRLVALASAVGDVVKARLLSRDDRFRLWPRLVLDAADLALWCMCAGDDTDTSEDAVIPGVPLAAEAGARLGLTGVAVPLVNATVASVVRRARGHRLRLEQFSWQIMGWAGGWVISVLTDYHRRRLEQLHEIDLSARVQEAELLGMHDLLTKHEGAIDLLQRATALIELGAPGVSDPRRDITGALKAEVARGVRSHSVYLHDALSLWQGRHNLHPDLSRLANVDLDPSAGAVILSDSQASELWNEMDARDLRGTVTVRLLDPAAAHAPVGRRDLLVNGGILAIDAPVRERRWRIDALPAAYLVQLGWLTQPTARHREAVPWSATLPAVLLAGGSTVWSARKDPETLKPWMALSLAFVTTLSYTVMSTRSMRFSHTASGISRYPWVMPLQGYEVVRNLVNPGLTTPAIAATLCGSGAIVVTGWVLSPEPRSLRALVAELGWVVGFRFFTRRLQRATADASTLIAEEVEADDTTILLEAHTRGRSGVESLIVTALGRARDMLRAASSRLPSDLREEASRRLDRVEEMLRGEMADLRFTGSESR